MSKDFILTTDELFGSYCYIEQKRYGVPNEKFLYKIIGKFTSNAWSNVPVDANDKDPHIFNHSEEVVNVVCCGVCEDKIERYKLSDVEIISNKDQQLADLEAKLAESESKVKVGEFWHSAYQGKQLDYDKVYAELRKSYDENEKLKQQLAEKEKKIKKLNLEAQKYYEDAYCNDFHNQDKISFCIEQLEKVKSAFGLINSKLDKIETIKEYIHYIDHQINELKEMK